MAKNPILDLPLTEVMRAEIALPLQQVFHVYTVGSFLSAWGNPKNQKLISQLFESPAEARNAAATCAAWLGISTQASPANALPGWWVESNTATKS